ncbi:MAG: hypothetical protein EAY75_10455 [Bacteroidetes bacterium]|nr:MAG: hypothetical protein EAY75_10455 [Bacteroidota bacterium]
MEKHDFGTAVEFKAGASVVYEAIAFILRICLVVLPRPNCKVWLGSIFAFVPSQLLHGYSILHVKRVPPVHQHGGIQMVDFLSFKMLLLFFLPLQPLFTGAFMGLVCKLYWV